MNISEVVVEGFRGLKVNVKLKRINIVLGENGSGKTSFLESIYLSTLFQSDMNDNDINTSLLYMLSSRGDFLSAFSTLSGSKVKLDDVTTQLKRSDPYSLDVEINGERVAEITVKSFSTLEIQPVSMLLPIARIEKRVRTRYSPLYISTFFESSGNPEKIYSIARRKSKDKVRTDLEILQDEYGQYKLYYGTVPVYVMGRGLLKRELIKLALMSSDILLIDEIEDSLHPDLVMEVLNDMKREEGVQVIFTTHVNEVVKMAGKVLNDSEAQVIYLSKAGYKTYKLSEISEFEKPLSWLGYV
jgi:AAA15 family ATPase/GTPase